MKAFSLALAFAMTSFAFVSDCPANDGKVPLNILYLSRQGDADRSEAFVEFLTTRFAKCVAVKRDDFLSSLLDGVDVVLLDWPQSERPSSDAASPLGPLENWMAPLVMLGSAGLLQSKTWPIIGGAG